VTQPGDMPPPTSNRAATSFLDVSQLTPTGDFGSRCDNDQGRVRKGSSCKKMQGNAFQMSHRALAVS